MTEQNKILSASRIKTLETCSWTYWVNYHLKIPQRSNDGSDRGTICHTVFQWAAFTILANFAIGRNSVSVVERLWDTR